MSLIKECEGIYGDFTRQRVTQKTLEVGDGEEARLASAAPIACTRAPGRSDGPQLASHSIAASTFYFAL